MHTDKSGTSIKQQARQEKAKPNSITQNTHARRGSTNSQEIPLRKLPTPKTNTSNTPWGTPQLKLCRWGKTQQMLRRAAQLTGVITDQHNLSTLPRANALAGLLLLLDVITGYYSVRSRFRMLLGRVERNGFHYGWAHSHLHQTWLRADYWRASWTIARRNTVNRE